MLTFEQQNSLSHKSKHEFFQFLPNASSYSLKSAALMRLFLSNANCLYRAVACLEAQFHYFG